MLFIIRRLVFYVVAAWSALTINFLLPHLLPGTAVEAMFSHYPDLTPSAIKALDIQFGLGHQGSLIHQYFVYLGHLRTATSASRVRVPDEGHDRAHETLPWTIALIGTATLISFGLGTLFGILAGWRRNGLFDKALPAATFLQATPYFFLALLAIQLFANTWHVFPLRRRAPRREHRASTGRSSAARWTTRSCRRRRSSSRRWRAGCCRCAT